MELSSETKHLISAKQAGDEFTTAESVQMSSEIINLLTVAGICVGDAVDLVHRFRDANWYAGYDSGYKRGTDENA